MYNNLTTYKQPLINLLKWLVVGFAFLFIYLKLTTNNDLSFAEFKTQITLLFSNPFWLFIILLLFTDANLLLEIKKWQLLVNIEKRINFFEAMEQVLASFTISIITPNRIGEYGAKVLFFEKKLRKKVLVLNFITNSYQLFATLLFGASGFYFFTLKYTFKNPFISINLWLFYFALFILLIALIYVFKWQKKVVKLKMYWKSISVKNHFLILGLSVTRFLIFSHQFYFLLYLFNVEIAYSTAISLIFCMYLLASVLPSLAIFDWAIKGSIALWLFQFEKINEVTIITITTLMWMLNFGLPALLGSVFVLNFKKKY